MPENKPFYRNYRKMKDGPNSDYSDGAYIKDKDYADNPQHYIRAYMYIQKDLEKLFEYIEPSEECLQVFSYKIHQLFMRTCIEIEANFKAILRANSYKPKQDKYNQDIYNILVYKIINKTHKLSDYKVILPLWNGEENEFSPYADWNSDKPLLWYKAYNKSKHDRSDEFKKANMENLLNAVSALLILISSQFQTETFSSGDDVLVVSGYDYHEGESAIGDLFRIEFPDTWTDDEVYSFDWNLLKEEEVKFNKINYNNLNL